MPPPDSLSTSSFIQRPPAVWCSEYCSGPSDVIVVAWPKTICPTSTVIAGSAFTAAATAAASPLFTWRGPSP